MHICTYTYISLHTGTVSIITEAENLITLSSAYQLDYSSVVHDGASDDKADKCSISGDHHAIQYVALRSTTTDNQCNYIRMYVVNIRSILMVNNEWVFITNVHISEIFMIRSCIK